MHSEHHRRYFEVYIVPYGEIVKIFTHLEIFGELVVQSKKFKSKSCSALNFLQKSNWAHMSISLGPPQIAQKWIYFPISVHYNNSYVAILGVPLIPLLGRYKHMHPTDFFVGNLILNNFCLEHF